MANKRKNLLGQRFGRLTVLSMDLNTKPNQRTAWNCRCDCGKEVSVKTKHLNSNSTRSCGCIRIKIDPNTRFYRLIAVKYVSNSKWLCHCDCGMKIIAHAADLKSGHTKSCGCFQKEKAAINIRRAHQINRKYSPDISSARGCWKDYCFRDKVCTLTFERWYHLSQDKCYYCGIEKYNSYNRFTAKKNASVYSKDNGYFSYNGIDRQNPSLPHTLENCVSCCPICNWAKLDKTVNEFYRYIAILQCPTIESFVPPTLLTLPTMTPLLSSIKETYHGYIKVYGQMEIDLETFYTYSQLPCFYCGREKLNHMKARGKHTSQLYRDNSHYFYNGIDKINNNFLHTLDNIVPSCIDCNTAKSDYTLEEFYRWIKRVQKINRDKIFQQREIK